MSDTTKKYRQMNDWNVLTDPWLEAMNLSAKAQSYSPLEAMNRSNDIHCIIAASPLDLFAAHRFLLTLLYWKAGVAGGVKLLRESLLRGEMPRAVPDAIETEMHRFRLFDDKAPFLQDPFARDGEQKATGYLFAEFASGTNIAHFHHGDDEGMRLCVRCATSGMLRVIPWTQSGGAGLTPSVHNAPPIMAVALGNNLAITLGLNLIPLSSVAGNANWSGPFAPTAKNEAIPYLEALTWNPRRINLRSPETADVCWRCGQTGVAAVGPIVYLKNESTSKRADDQPFQWRDPAAFYAPDAPYTTRKSSNEKQAADGLDLTRLQVRENAPASDVVATNPNHQGWHLVVPCTDPANNKTYDHRLIELTALSPEAIRARLPAPNATRGPNGFDGWAEPLRAACTSGAACFVRAAARLFTNADWGVLSAAAYREMQDSPAAFDLFSGLLWSLRGKAKGLPSKSVAWLVLKLMAYVPSRARVAHAGAVFNPLSLLPKRQIGELRENRHVPSIYPVSFPLGCRLETGLRKALDSNMRKRPPGPIDWAGLCHCLDQLLD